MLTLQDAEFEKLMLTFKCSNVENLGCIPRDEVLQRLGSVSALIFPSKAETFGIPLLEASALNCPIIASNLDYVWDVCEPDITFNPDSVRSITRAVKQFMGIKKISNKVDVVSPMAVASLLQLQKETKSREDVT